MGTQFHSWSANYSLNQVSIQMISIEIEIMASKEISRLTSIMRIEIFGVLRIICELNDCLVVWSVYRLECFLIFNTLEAVFGYLHGVTIASNWGFSMEEWLSERT